MVPRNSVIPCRRAPPMLFVMMLKVFGGGVVSEAELPMCSVQKKERLRYRVIRGFLRVERVLLFILWHTRFFVFLI